MGGDYLKPKAMSREEVLKTFNGDGADKWRNPYAIDGVTGGWPRPQGERAKRYERMMGTQTEWSRKGRPI